MSPSQSVRPGPTSPPTGCTGELAAPACVEVQAAVLVCHGDMVVIYARNRDNDVGEIEMVKH